MQLRRIAVVTAVVVAGSLAPATSASAETLGTVVKGPGTACANSSAWNTHVKVCYQTDGDYLYVYDGAADGRSAWGTIRSPERRQCRNAAGNGTWVRCNFNLEKDGSRLLFVGHTRDNEGIFNPDRNVTEDAEDVT